jgi:hypothetical protein
MSVRVTGTGVPLLTVIVTPGLPPAQTVVGGGVLVVGQFGAMTEGRGRVRPLTL